MTSKKANPSTDKSINIDALLDEICQRGCKVSRIKDAKAKEFIEKVALKKQAGEMPNFERAAELLQEIWEVPISRRALSEHIRGKCGCKKKK